ncbi:hypothetical protein NE865_10202 [Phthorimaea operculella]|nr:hypothetical protein NE865_10202 [Phthorimaea operculella]
MENQYSSDSNISTDSLERNRQQPPTKNEENSDENVDTILVPFYENDVLIKVPKIQKKVKKSIPKSKKEDVPNYLINKNKKKSNSYLEMFRRQFSSPTREPERTKDDYEVSSLQPEFGDTERESIGDDNGNPVEEFFNTESYNEMFYEKLLNQDMIDYLDDSMDQILALHDNEVTSKSHEDEECIEDNLRSVSEVTPPRRRSRYRTAEPIPNVKLGGLGADMERIRPRLERARSLQRYSEKVRMENRLRIYKKSVEADKRTSREPSAKRQGSAKEPNDAAKDQNPSYLLNKVEEQKVNIIKKVYESKCKSANAKLREMTKGKRINKQTEEEKVKNVNERGDRENCNEKKRQTRARKTMEKNSDKDPKGRETRPRVKSTARSQGVNTEGSSLMPPVQISFMVNVGGVRPSSALKTLEEQHRMYQEQVKAFTLDNN